MTVRIPNLPIGKMVEEDGTPTDDEITFRQALVTSLQAYMGNEGLVMPSQAAANILIIQNHKTPNPDTGVYDIYTCEFGTMIYESDTGFVKVAVEDPLGSGIPVFKSITYT